MVFYECQRCGYSTKNRTYYRKHLHRKYPCKPKKSDISKNLKGKTITDISLSNSTFENVEFAPHGKPGEFIGYTTSPHNLYLTEFLTISGLSTNLTDESLDIQNRIRDFQNASREYQDAKKIGKGEFDRHIQVVEGI